MIELINEKETKRSLAKKLKISIVSLNKKLEKENINWHRKHKKLTSDDKIKIINLSQYLNQAEIAKIYNVNQSTISRTLGGQAHVTVHYNYE